MSPRDIALYTSGQRPNEVWAKRKPFSAIHTSNAKNVLSHITAYRLSNTFPVEASNTDKCFKIVAPTSSTVHHSRSPKSVHYHVKLRFCLFMTFSVSTFERCY